MVTNGYERLLTVTSGYKEAAYLVTERQDDPAIEETE